MSKEVIEGLEPAQLWENFYLISQVPRPSKKEGKIREFIKKFAQEKNLAFKEDQLGNIVVKADASPGYQQAPTVVLQGHIDMVCEKNKETVHDFENDPIKLLRDGDWIKADGTTLGADNGLGVAAALTVALDKDAVHGPLEILCTIDEETGMTGVNGLQPGFITGKTLLNLDSEEDGAFYVGCSGGQDTEGIFKLKWKSPKKKSVPYELTITGLKGGHSGLDINSGRANAIKLLGFLLNRLSGVKFAISEISGGSLRNAIPREAEVTLLINPKNESKVKEIIDNFVADTLKEYKLNDGGLLVDFKKKDGNPEKVFRKKFTKRLIKILLAMPNGVIAMSPSIKGLVETSTNLATIKMDNEKLIIGTSQRSSIESAKDNISDSVAAILKLGKGKVNVGSSYPGWQPNMDSKLLKISKEVFSNLFGKEPEIKAIHAGLETGLLGSKYPGLDMISFGPTIQGAHSPDERVNIKDVEKFYNLLKGILAKLTE